MKVAIRQLTILLDCHIITFARNTIRYDTIVESNVDSKAEYTT